MKRLTHLFSLVLAMLVLVQCDPSMTERTPDPGQADFSSYVAIGNSLTAGYSDNALHRDGQLNSFPAIIAGQMQQADGNDFVQPLVDPGVGSNADGQARLILQVVIGQDGTPDLAPAPAATQGQDIFSQQQQGPFNNMGIPGARSFHLVAPEYGGRNPFYGRIMSSPEATVLGDAMMAEPGFFTLWIGNNDVLGYATSGGTGQGFVEIGNPAAVAGNDITPQNVFNGAIDGITSTLAASDADGVIINIPDVTNIPFFTTVPWNALVLDAETAQFLRSEYAKNVPEDFVPDFQEGANGFIIADPDLEDRPEPLRFRMATQDDLILLPAAGPIQSQNWGSVEIIPDQYTLRAPQIQQIQTATQAFNAKLAANAANFGFAFVDVNATLETASNQGMVFDAVRLTTDYIQGGIFSLDGVHLTPRGSAVVANQVIEAINDAFGSTLCPVNVSAYEGVPFP